MAFVSDVLKKQKAQQAVEFKSHKPQASDTV
jgi:hypothetical protein